MREISHFIAGRAAAGTSGRFGEVFDPNLGEVQARVALAALELAAEGLRLLVGLGGAVGLDAVLVGLGALVPLLAGGEEVEHVLAALVAEGRAEVDHGALLRGAVVTVVLGVRGGGVGERGLGAELDATGVEAAADRALVAAGGAVGLAAVLVGLGGGAALRAGGVLLDEALDALGLDAEAAAEVRAALGAGVLAVVLAGGGALVEERALRVDRGATDPEAEVRGRGVLVRGARGVRAVVVAVAGRAGAAGARLPLGADVQPAELDGPAEDRLLAVLLAGVVGLCGGGAAHDDESGDGRGGQGALGVGVHQWFSSLRRRWGAWPPPSVPSRDPTVVRSTTPQTLARGPVGTQGIAECASSRARAPIRSGRRDVARRDARSRRGRDRGAPGRHRRTASDAQPDLSGLSSTKG